MHAGSKLACCASSRETASVVARSRVPRESRLILDGHRWHVAPRPHAEGERPLASVVSLPSASVDRNQRSTVHARSKLECCAFSRETASAEAHLRVPRKSLLIVGAHHWHIIPGPYAEGDKPLAGVVPLPSTRIDISQRGTAQVLSKLECCASS